MPGKRIRNTKRMQKNFAHTVKRTKSLNTRNIPLGGPRL